MQQQRKEEEIFNVSIALQAGDERSVSRLQLKDELEAAELLKKVLAAMLEPLEGCRMEETVMLRHATEIRLRLPVSLAREIRALIPFLEAILHREGIVLNIYSSEW